MGQIVVASRLTDGRVVFLAGLAPARWSETIDEALVAHQAGRAEELQASAQAAAVAHQVVEPYLVDITETDGQRRPLVWREAIRVEGPTVRTDLPPEAAAISARRQVTGRTAARSGRRLGR